MKEVFEDQDLRRSKSNVIESDSKFDMEGYERMLEMERKEV